MWYFFYQHEVGSIVYLDQSLFLLKMSIYDSYISFFAIDRVESNSYQIYSRSTIE